MSAGCRADEGGDLFAPFFVRQSDHRDFADLGVTKQQLFELARIDVFAAADDHVLQAALYRAIAARVHRAEIAGMQPAVAIDRGGGRLGHFEVAEHDVIAAGAVLADFADRQISPVSGLTILVSMLGSGRPMVAALSSIVSVVRVCAATGEHSVCPNTMVNGAPSFCSNS